VYRTVTQYSMKPIEEIGLLKMDFLGLRNLDVIEDALDIVERSTGERPDMTTLPLDDPPTYEMLARGDSIGVFQFESEGMREALKKVLPTEFDDLVALNALYRPGAMDQIPTTRAASATPTPCRFPTTACGRSRPTKGVILYQEQAMQIAKTIAGFSGPRPDDLRKAIGKKKRERWPSSSRSSSRAGCVRHESRGHRVAVGDQRAQRRLFVQQGPRRLLRADRLPHRVAEGQPSAEYMAALISSSWPRRTRCPSSSPVARTWASRSCRGRQRVRSPVRRGRGQHPLRAQRGQGVGHAAVEANQAGARGGRPVHVAVGLLRASRLPHGQQEVD